MTRKIAVYKDTRRRNLQYTGVEKKVVEKRIHHHILLLLLIVKHSLPTKVLLSVIYTQNNITFATVESSVFEPVCLQTGSSDSHDYPQCCT